MARRLILDSGAIIAYVRGDKTVRSLLHAVERRSSEVVVPPIVLTQTLRGGGQDALIHKLQQAAVVPHVDRDVARAAGELLGRTGLNDAADAQVMAEARRGVPSTVLTSDQADMTVLAERSPHVAILPV
ncbi:MAG: PIN domain-containing protein [Chloroflexota bacterium]